MNKSIELVQNYDNIKNDKQFKINCKTIYTPVQLILRNLFKSHWIIIFLNEVLDGALIALSGKEFQGVTTLEPQKYFHGVRSAV